MHSHAERGNDQATIRQVLTIKLMAQPLASSRLKPVPLKERIQSAEPASASPTAQRVHPLGPASAGKPLICAVLLIFIRKKPRHHKTRLGCGLNAADAEWAERHGCRESAVRTWMSVRRGPTEHRRSEGTLTKEGPNQEQAPLVTWGAFPSNSPKAKYLPLGRCS